MAKGQLSVSAAESSNKISQGSPVACMQEVRLDDQDGPFGLKVYESEGLGSPQRRGMVNKPDFPQTLVNES